MTKGYELAILHDAKKIKTYREFYQSIDKKQEEFPVPIDAINDVYTIDWDKPSYIKFADMAEEVISDSYYKLSHKQLKGYRTKYPLLIRIEKKLIRVDFLYNIYLNIINNPKCKMKWIERQRRIRKENEHTIEKVQYEGTSEEEIEKIQKRIREQIYREDKK